MPELGISPTDKDALRNQVSIVFNSAARLKFDDKLKDALEPNVFGPQRLVELCRDFKCLKVKAVILFFDFYFIIVC